MTYKEEHEAFVSGSNGTTVFNIAVTIVASILPVHLRDLLVCSYPNIYGGSFWYSLLFDFTMLVVPMEMFMSVLGSFTLPSLLFVAILIILTCAVNLTKRNNQYVLQTSSLYAVKMGNRRPFITYYRAFVNIFTAFCILAVDFVVFPREFAKTETFGTGLMDVGVGCFLISNAIVSPEARGKSSADKPQEALLKSLKSCIPLLVIGGGRVLAVKSTDYQEHVTEYGVHWNFFFTLAAVKVLCTVLFCGVPARLWNITGVLIIALYQHNLTYDGLTKYLIKGKDGAGGRGDLLDANREGIFSCMGYLSLYVLAVQLGKLLMKKRETVKEWVKLCIHLSFVSFSTYVMMYYCVKYVEPVSRRFANLGYVLWMLSFNSLLILAILVCDIIVTCIYHLSQSVKYTESQKKTDPPSNRAAAEDSDVEDTYKTSDLMYAINHNGLFYFLFANVLTGFVNMSVQTIYQSTPVAMVILTVYMFLLSAVSTYMYRHKITLKMW